MSLASRPTRELLRSLAVFRILTIPVLVRNARSLLGVSERVLGAHVTHRLVRRTLFAQFCGGESAADLAPTIAALGREGVGSILDYAAEADEAPANAGTLDTEAARRAASEAHSDACLRLCMESVAAATKTGGFCAVKATGMVDPELLKSVTTLMHDHRRAFRALLPSPLPEGDGEQPLYTSALISRASFLHAINNAVLAVGQESVDPSLLTPRVAEALWDLLDVRRVGSIDYLDFVDVARLLGFGSERVREAAAAAVGVSSADDALALLLCAGRPKAALPPHALRPGLLSPDARLEWAAALSRLAALCASARESGVSLMVDAEQSYLQAAIDLAVVTMQRTFNSSHAMSSTAASTLWPRLLPEEEHALTCGRSHVVVKAASATAKAVSGASHSLPPIIPVFNTYQAYLRDAPSRLALAIARAKREGWHIGIKLVRGAYMTQERERAEALRYNDPIHATIEGTHGCYAVCVSQLLSVARQLDGAFMVASHNRASCEAVAKEVGVCKQQKEQPRTSSDSLRDARCAGGVSFGQLLGMSDGLTFSLSARGLAAFKYVPYGPVQEVLPYLLRRAEENSDLLTSNVREEIRELQAELWTRATQRKR